MVEVKCQYSSMSGVLLLKIQSLTSKIMLDYSRIRDLKLTNFSMKVFNFYAEKILCILHWQVFVMVWGFDSHYTSFWLFYDGLYYHCFSSSRKWQFFVIVLNGKVLISSCSHGYRAAIFQVNVLDENSSPMSRQIFALYYTIKPMILFITMFLTHISIKYMEHFSSHFSEC